jgi:predicted dehydrogenase
MSGNPINTALCSIGMSGIVFHAPFIEVNPNFHFYAVWERTKNVAAEKYPGVKMFRDFEEMIADEKVELVVVNTPNISHYELCKKSLLAGKHVIVEKPFVPSVEEGLELISIAEKNNLILSVYHNRRYDSDFKTIQKILNENLIGDIREAEFHYDRFDNNLSYKIHKETPAKGTGCLYDLGSHLIDQALELFGMPEKIFADIFSMRPISKVDDYFELILYYQNFRVRLKASYQVRELLPGYILHGSKGSFIKAKADVQESKLLKGEKPSNANWGIEPVELAGILHTDINGKIIREQFVSEKGNYMEYYQGISDSIKHGQPLPVSALNGLDVIKIIEAAFKSNEEKKIINL